MIKLYYIHDPMCSWCWAYRPTLDKLRQHLPESVRWRNLLGGLAPDSADPMPDETRKMVRENWRRIQRELGTDFNFEFWKICKPRRSTYIACRGVLAACAQEMEEAMILSIQKAYYLRAMNPSDEDTLVMLADELGMDSQRFRSNLLSQETNRELLAQITRARSWQVPGFPSLVLENHGSVRHLPLDYRDHQVTLAAIRASRDY